LIFYIKVNCDRMLKRQSYGKNAWRLMQKRNPKSLPW